MAVGGQAWKTEGEASVKALQPGLGETTWLGSGKRQIPLHKFPLHEDVYSIRTVWLLHWKVYLDVITVVQQTGKFAWGGHCGL